MKTRNFIPRKEYRGGLLYTLPNKLYIQRVIEWDNFCIRWRRVNYDPRRLVECLHNVECGRLLYDVCGYHPSMNEVDVGVKAMKLLHSLTNYKNQKRDAFNTFSLLGDMYNDVEKRLKTF